MQIDKAAFHNSRSSLITQWNADKRSGTNVFGDVGIIILVMGKSDESGNIHKANGMQFWLLGYEFPATLFLVTLEAMYFVTTKKKATYLEVLKDGKTPVEVIVRGKDAEENTKQFERINDIIQNAGKKVGTFAKDPTAGPFVTDWKSAFSEISKDVEEFDVSIALPAAVAVKDENELKAIRNASSASAALMRDSFVETMSDTLDKEKKTTHRVFSDKVSQKLEDDNFFKNIKGVGKLDSQQLDWSIHPVVQSGGILDLELAAEPDNNNLHQPTTFISPASSFPGSACDIRVTLRCLREATLPSRTRPGRACTDCCWPFTRLS